MKCPECGADTRVIRTRNPGETTQRRHECFNSHRFSTLEVPLEEVAELRRKAGRLAVFRDLVLRETA